MGAVELHALWNRSDLGVWEVFGQDCEDHRRAI